MWRTRLVMGVALGLVWITSGAAHAEGDLGIEADATYELNSAESRLEVRIAFLITNQKPSTRSGYVTTRYYFDRFAVLLPDEATDVVVSDGAGHILDAIDAYEELDDEGTEGRVLTITLPRRIFHRGEQAIVVSFHLPGGEPRSESMVRANPAYAAFAAWAWGDPDLSSVTIRIPKGFEADYAGDRLRTIDEAGFNVWYEESVDDPDDWGVFFTARDDTALVDETITVDGLTVTVRSWPGDPTWAERVADVVRGGLPALQSSVGLDFGDQTTLAVLEALDPSLLGYAGWYLTDEDVIELSEDLDDHVIIHEIAHLWFNEDLFTERWINEGLAEEFAAEAVAAIGAEADPGYGEVSRPIANLSIAVPLNRWELPLTAPSEDDAVWRREDYGYDASFWLVRTLRAEVGAEALQAVLAAAAGDLTAYQDGTDPETVDPTDGWWRFLDLVEQLAGSEEAEGLFREFVVSTEDLILLDQRRAAREAYAALLAADTDWETPWAVRESMGEWRFPVAEDHIATAMDVIALRDQVADTAARLDLVPPEALETAYEGAAEAADLDTAAALGAEQWQSVTAVASAREAVDAPRGFFAGIGLIGEDPETEFQEAAEAFEDGHHDAAGAEAAEVVALIAAADDVGTGRVLWASGGLATLAGAIAAAWVLARRSRGRSPEPEPEA
jgi:hypothetical protein